MWFLSYDIYAPGVVQRWEFTRPEWEALSCTFLRGNTISTWQEPHSHSATQPFVSHCSLSHRKSACVNVHVSGTVTFNRLCSPHTERSHRRKEGERGDASKIKSHGAPVHAHVKLLCHVGVSGRFLVWKVATLTLYSPLCWRRHHPGPRGPPPTDSKKSRKTRGPHTTLRSAQVCIPTGWQRVQHST